MIKASIYASGMIAALIFSFAGADAATQRKAKPSAKEAMDQEMERLRPTIEYVRPPKREYPSPGEIVAAAKAEDWVAIAPSDLLVMDLAADAKAKSRRVVIQLMPAPFSQGWIGNIRKLASAKFWDGTSVNRVQDNYVVQWGDATEKKKLPDGLAVVPESSYLTEFKRGMFNYRWGRGREQAVKPDMPEFSAVGSPTPLRFHDTYTGVVGFAGSFPIGMEMGLDESVRFPEYNSGAYLPKSLWPVHCYAMVGVGRNLSPDTGTGAELYTVIGHAPRHLDRNIALVGRVIEGIEHLSSLPRGTGALGFYEKAEERVQIVSVRLGDAVAGLVPYEYLSTESESFARYADARANRRDPFFIKPAGGADICNIPVPVRRRVTP